jgi:hypothetical protein
VANWEDQANVKVLRIAAGLSILRYVSAEDAGKTPTIRLAPRTSATRLQLIPVPGEPEPVLRAPGAAIVLVAETETELAVTIIRQPGSRSAAVDLHLELLARAVTPASAMVRREDRHIGSSMPQPNRITVLGHVARRGDVLVATGEWLGGPEFPARIEGIEIRWPDMPRDLQLEYSVVVGGPTLRKSSVCRVSEFAGTKGRAVPIVRLALALSGATASSYRIKADCLFLGGQMISESGQKVALSGPTGKEPLVGFRLWIEAIAGLNLSAPSSQLGAGGLRLLSGSASARRKL